MISPVSKILETEQLLQAGRSGDSQLSNEAVMILNHKAAIEFLLESASEANFDRREAVARLRLWAEASVI
jgi:hypothetical protein